MSIHAIDLNNAATESILNQIPILNGLVTFETRFMSTSRMHLGFWVDVRINNHEAYQVLDAHKQGSLHNILSQYMSCDPGMGEFKLDTIDWFIGDGDDTGAVIEIDSYHVQLWLRRFF